MLRRSKIWKAWSYWVVFSAVVVVFGGQIGLTRSTLFGTPAAWASRCCAGCLRSRGLQKRYDSDARRGAAGCGHLPSGD